jgi:hypothetical protein
MGSANVIFVAGVSRMGQPSVRTSTLPEGRREDAVDDALPMRDLCSGAR